MAAKKKKAVKNGRAKTNKGKAKVKNARAKTKKARKSTPKRGKGRPKTRIEPPKSDEDISLEEFQKMLPSFAELANDKKSALANKTIMEAFYRRVKAEKEWVTLQTLKGDLIPKDEVEALLTARAIEFKSAFRKLENSLAPTLVGKDDPRITQGILHDAFKAMLLIYTRE